MIRIGGRYRFAAAYDYRPMRLAKKIDAAAHITPVRWRKAILETISRARFDALRDECGAYLRSKHTEISKA
jgi:hypothetical protein